MPVDKSEFRRMMGQFATGVTIVTARSTDGSAVGLTANSVTSVSLEPPLLLFCIDHSAECYPTFRDAEHFTVNILAEGQEELSSRFATKSPEKFSEVAQRPRSAGGVVLEEACAWMDCAVYGRHDVGDHTILIGRVEDGDTSDRAPLLFYRGGYRRLSDD